jgi:hypothetical protein
MTKNPASEGIWAIEFARRHPGSQVVGSDLSLIQPDVSATVPNVSFVREDAEDEWVYEPGTLDFSCFCSHRAVIRSAYAHLRPGGWIEYQDIMPSVDADDESHRGTALHRWGYLTLAGAAGRGRDMEAARKYAGYMREAGFVDVVEIPWKLPGNGWPDREPDRTIGNYMVLAGAEALQASSDKLLGEGGLGLPEDLVKPIVAQAQQDIFDTKIHFWWPG